MTERYNLMMGRKYKTSGGQEKTAWTRVGAMFPNRSGKGFSIALEALPLVLDEKGGVRIQAFPAKARGERGEPRERRGEYSEEDYGAGAVDDFIPF